VIPAAFESPGQAEDALAGYAASLAGRDDLVLAALAAGITKHRIHVLSGIARTTIDKIVAGNGETGEPS
jgi:hypothetical protein